MTNKDLSKLKIDKSDAFHYYSKRQKLLSKITVAILVILTGFILYRVVFNPTYKVKVATVSQVYPSQMFTLLNASGYVVAQRKAAVSSKATGRLEWLGVEEGSRVKKGQIIARLENEDVVAARDQAEANLKNALSSLEMVKAEWEEATLNYNRQKDLVSHGVVSQSEFDIAVARYKKAQAAVTAAESSINAYKAALHAARIAVKYTFIRSPFDAVVLTKNADVGDIITPLGAAANAKAAVVTIADMDSLLVEADVSESNLQKVSAGQPCEIQLDTFPEIRFRAMVHMIVPTADRSKASVMIKVKFLDKDKRVLPEMSARVAFLERPVSPDEQKPKTVLSANAIIEYTGNAFVFLVKDNHAVKTPLVTGILIDNMIEVLQGVKPGDTIIVNPPNRLKNGSGITIQEK